LTDFGWVRYKLKEDLVQSKRNSSADELEMERDVASQIKAVMGKPPT
jgi:hypothetical protein